MRHQTLYLLISAASVSCQPTKLEPIDFGERQFVASTAPPQDADLSDDGATAYSSQEEQRTECVPAPPNLLRNGSFEHRPIHACGWDTYDVADWGIVAASYCVSDEHPGCAVYLATEVWGEHWVAQFSQDVNLEPGRPYVFTFEAKAAGVVRPLLVSVLGGGPLRDQYGDLALGAGVELELPTEWRTYVFSFVATEHAEDSIVDFAIGGADTGLYLDNVMLVRTPPPPAASADGGT